MVQYKLHYFDLRGLGECIRLLLHYVGQPFEDVRFPIDQWLERKQKYFYGKVPVLEVDGKELAQSMAILRYLADKFGLAGKDEWERAKANELLDYQKDVYAEFAPYFYAKMGIREGNVEQLRKEVFEPGAARHLPMYEKLLAQSGSGFLLPSGLTMVDFVVADYLLSSFSRLEPDSLQKHPALVAYAQKVHSLPQLQQYLGTRKD